MAIYTQALLTQASDLTYYDNNNNEISAADVRALNNDWISSSILVPMTASMTVLSSSYAVTASYVSGSSTSAISASYATTASFAITASYALNAIQFPYTGSAQITGSLGVTRSISINDRNSNIKFATKDPVGSFGFNIFIGGGGEAVNWASGNDGAYNISLGSGSLNALTFGHSNVAIGTETLFNTTTNDRNTALGHGALYHLTSGEYNTAIGHSAGNTTKLSLQNTSADQSVFLGALSGPSAVGNTNEIAIGYNSRGNGSNTITLGNTATTRLFTSASIVAPSYTGSLFGTSSWAVSASFALNNVNGFPYTGSAIISGSLVVTGSVSGRVLSGSISSNTCSINLALANYFVVTLPDATTTFFNVTNPQPGQTSQIVVTTGTNCSASFSSNVLQPSQSFYRPTSEPGTDVLSLVAVNTSKVLLVNSKQFV